MAGKVIWTEVVRSTRSYAREVMVELLQVLLMSAITEPLYIQSTDMTIYSAIRRWRRCDPIT